MKNWTFTIFAICLTATLSAQLPFKNKTIIEKELWSSEMHIFCDDIIQLNDTQYLVTGYTDKRFIKNIFISKLTLEGDTIDPYIFGGVNVNDQGTRSIINSKGIIINVGQTKTYADNGGYDGYILELDKNLKWITAPKAIGGNDHEIITSIKQDKNNEYYIAINKENGLGFYATSETGLICKLDENLIQKWCTKVSTRENNAIYDITILHDGNILATGYENNSLTDKRNALVVKVNSITGEIIWRNTYIIYEKNIETAESCVETKDNKIIITGISAAGIMNSGALFIVLSSNGEKIVGKTLTNDSGQLEGNQVWQNKNGDIVLIGQAGSKGYIALVDNIGNFLYYQTFDGIINSGFQNNKGEYILIGKKINMSDAKYKYHWGLYFTKLNIGK